MNKTLYYIILIGLFLPSLQRLTNIIPVRALNGDFKEAERPVFNKEGWLSGSFQNQYISFCEYKTGFRNFLVRLNNQLDYSLFRKGNAEGIVIGKNNNLFEKDYIRAYLGGDFIGERATEKKIRRLKFLQDTLRKKGIDLILVFEPGKASFSPEDIPDSYYKRYLPGRSNYQSFIEMAVKHNVRFLDFNNWFKSLKDKTPYPLYVNTGIHWSHYGMYVAADSLISFLENLRHVDLPEMVLDRWESTTEARVSDYDAAYALNLLGKIRNPRLAYPVFHFPDGKEKQRISVLTVADSYYWNIYNTRLPLHLFNNEAFWYFNSLVYPDSYYQEKKTDSVDILAETEKQDVIFLMVTERFLYKFDWDFIDRLFEAYTPELQKDYPYLYEGKIRGYSAWFDTVEMKAQRSGKTLQAALTQDALYTFMNEKKEDYLLFFGTAHYAEMIRNNEDWLRKERSKSLEMKMDPEAVILQDADLLFRNEYPEIHRKYHEIRRQIMLIRNDKKAMAKVKTNPYYLSSDDMLWQVAVARVNGGPQSLAFMSW